MGIVCVLVVIGLYVSNDKSSVWVWVVMLDVLSVWWFMGSWVWVVVMKICIVVYCVCYMCYFIVVVSVCGLLGMLYRFVLLCVVMK